MSLERFDLYFSLCISFYTIFFVVLIVLLIDAIRIKMKKLFIIYLSCFITALYFLLISFITSIREIAYYGKEINTTLISLTIIACLSEIMTIIFAGYWVRYQHKNYLNNNAVKEGIDHLAGGLCYFNKEGRILLENEKMNELVHLLSETSYDNGFQIWECVKNKNQELLDFDKNDNIMIVEIHSGVYFKFALNEKRIDKMTIYEIIATDVTMQEQLNRKLIDENEQLESINHRLKQYNYNVEKLIAEEEILNAKIKLHDNYGKLLLSANKSLAVSSTNEERKQNLALWRNNLSLVSIKEQDSFDNDFEELKRVGKSVGVTIHFVNEVTISDKKLYDVFFTAIHECLTNTVAHANGSNLYVDFSIDKDKYTISLSNDGNKPEKKIIYGGGLNNLNHKVKKLSGTMKVLDKEMFTIQIEIPIGVMIYER